MNNRIGLFRQAVKTFVQTQKTSARKLYTDHIYPYPFNYFNNKVYPGRVCYRETWPQPPWARFEEIGEKIVMRTFWTIFWYQLFWHPEVIIGHHSFPDPTDWTDVELGIPPDDAGSYRDWLKAKMEREEN